MINHAVTASAAALEAASVADAEVWIHGSITYVTTPDVVEEVKPTKKSKVAPVEVEQVV